MERKVVNKLLSITVKFYPFLNSIGIFTNILLHYFDYNVRIIDYFVLTNFSSIILLYLLSIVLKFCNYHRIFIHYMLLEFCLDLYDEYFSITLQDKHFMYLQMILFCISLLEALYFYLYDKSNKRIISYNNRKHRCR